MASSRELLIGWWKKSQLRIFRVSIFLLVALWKLVGNLLKVEKRRFARSCLIGLRSCLGCGRRLRGNIKLVDLPRQKVPNLLVFHQHVHYSICFGSFLLELHGGPQV